MYRIILNCIYIILLLFIYIILSCLKFLIGLIFNLRGTPVNTKITSYLLRFVNRDAAYRASCKAKQCGGS